MAIQHRDIQDPDIHEPKGISTAAAGTSYRANGIGSGVFRKDLPSDLEGLSGAQPGDRVLIAPDGLSFSSRKDFALGSMLVLSNDNGFTVSSAADSTLNSNADYVLFSGNGAPWQADSIMNGVTFSTDRLTVTSSGIYKIEIWAVIKGFPTNSAMVSLKYRRNGTLFGPAKAMVKSNSAGDYGNISAFGITELQGGDFIQLAVASTDAGSLTFDSIRMSIILLQAT